MTTDELKDLFAIILITLSSFPLLPILHQILVVNHLTHISPALVTHIR